MNDPESIQREQWGTKIGFILAAAGSAIGLGNVWKFPYITGENGGAAFVLVYLFCIVIIGWPIMLAELTIGRKAQRNPVGAFKILKPNSLWFLVGSLGILAGFFILSYYSVVAGWMMAYAYKAVTGVFQNFPAPASAGEHFGQFSASPLWSIVIHALFMILCILIVSKGIKGGIERWSKILMPVLFIILILLVIRGVTLPGGSRGLSFLFKPDFSSITPTAVLIALGHAFFTLSLGMGAMITYGSYMSESENLPFNGLMVVFLDTFIALLAGVAIFTSVFAMNLDPTAGPGLVFHVLPAVFQQMPGGILFGTLFFLLMTIAALTSGISLLEVVSAYFIDEQGWKRQRAVLSTGAIIFLIGIPSALSFGLMRNWTFFFKMNVFDFVDFLAVNYMLPIGGLMIAFFAGWIWGSHRVIEEMRVGNPNFLAGPYWSFLVRFITPLGILVVIGAVVFGGVRFN
ncbi:MAG: sodium-dependent transporter [Gemmatimonadota bacterium]|nr:MAG: sodium-dependent transporter [Gemmatimonadota bacterium]